MEGAPLADQTVHSVSVAGIVVDEAGRVLVIQRRDNGHWEPPGGILERDETFEQGVAREVFEETGVQVDVERLTGVYKNMTRGIVALVYRCRPLRGSPTTAGGATTDETTQTRWITPAEIDALVAPVYAVRAFDALAGRTASRAHDGTALLAVTPRVLRG